MNVSYYRDVGLKHDATKAVSRDVDGAAKVLTLICVIDQSFYDDVLTSSLGHAVIQGSGDLKRIGEVSKPGPCDANPDSGSVTEVHLCMDPWMP